MRDAGCGFEFPDIDLTDGESRNLSGGSSQANIPDERWPEALALVGEIAGRRGFQGPKVTLDRPGDHLVGFHDAYGARLDFGTEVATVTGVSTGCHLTAEAKRRGAPTTPTLTLPPDLTEPN